LLGLRYVPPFDFFYGRDGNRVGRLVDGGQQHVAWRITSADFVTTESGTGAVHEAPAFGEVDFELLQREQARFLPGEGPEMICAVDPSGKMTADAGNFAGCGERRRQADYPTAKRIRRLFHQEVYQHEYPFVGVHKKTADPISAAEFGLSVRRNFATPCWPTMQESIGLPEHIRDGRFGNFLESNVDWALSRERYWGTPLPIWSATKRGRWRRLPVLRKCSKNPVWRG
jgi:isoleucyl-tRNA synthetase